MPSHSPRYLKHWWYARHVYATATTLLLCMFCSPHKMKELAVYLLLVLGGNAAPSAADIKTAAESANITVDEEAITQLKAAVEGKVC